MTTAQATPTTSAIQSRAPFGTALDASTVRIERRLPGPIERVWRYLTESELRNQWLASGDMVLEPGARFELTWRNDRLSDPTDTRPEGMSAEHRATCEILEVDPPRKLRYRWDEAGEVTMELVPEGKDVLLTLTHRRLSNRRLVLGVSAGWHVHLDILAARLAGTQPPSLWREWSALRAEYERRVPQ
ncbi:MAG: SRPBCC family protein [Proteobacteria bacterium]|nr:SRPBCC family protein [Pseudomonadota bacterium]